MHRSKGIFDISKHIKILHYYYFILNKRLKIKPALPLKLSCTNNATAMLTYMAAFPCVYVCQLFKQNLVNFIWP